MVGGNGYKKTAGGLRIEQKILVFTRDARRKLGAFANKGSIVFQARGKVAFAGSFNGTRKIRERSVVDFKRDRLEPMSRVAERHLSSGPKQAETSHVRHRVNGLGKLRLLFDFMKGSGSRGIQRAHPSDGCGKRLRSCAFFLQGRSDDPSSERLGKEQHVPRLRSHVAPDTFRINQTSDRITEQHVLIADRVAADDAALRFAHFGEAASNNLLKDFGIALFRKPDNGQRGDGPAAHSVNVAQRVGGRNLPEEKWVVHDRRKKINRLDEREAFAD